MRSSSTILTPARSSGPRCTSALGVDNEAGWGSTWPPPSSLRHRQPPRRMSFARKYDEIEAPRCRDRLRLAFLGCGFITGVHSRHLDALRRDVVVQLREPRPRARPRRSAASIGGAASYGDYAAAHRRPGRRCRRRRRAAAVPPGADAARRSPPASTCWSRSRRSRAWTTTRPCARRAIAPGASCWSARTITTSRSRCACGGCSRAARSASMVFAHFTTIARRLKTADDWRNDEAMAGGDAFFEEGIHWLHLAGSLGPRIVDIRRATGPTVAGATGPDRRAEEHDGRVPVRQRRGRRAVLLARDPVALRGAAAVEAVRPRGRHHVRVERRCSCSCAGAGLPRLVLPGFARHPRLPGDVSRLRRRRSASGARRR